MAAVTICSDFGAQENKVSYCFHCFPSICHEVMEPDVMILVFWMLSFKPAFSFLSFIFIKKLCSSSSLSAIRVVSSAYLRLLIFIIFDDFNIYHEKFLLEQKSSQRSNKEGIGARPSVRIYIEKTGQKSHLWDSILTWKLH